MPIIINEFKTPITPQEARDFLQSQTDNFGVFFDVDRCYELAAILSLENRDILHNLRKLSCRPNLSLDDKNDVIATLKFMGVSPIEFKSGKSSKKATKEGKEAKDSIDDEVRTKILQSGLYSPEVAEFLKQYSTYTSNKRNRGNITNFALLPQSVALSKYNHRMSRGCPTWNILSTSRIAAEKPGIQGIPRTMGDIVTEPKGYTLYRCDSGQIEPRINFSTYLRDELIMRLFIFYNDAYYGLLHFCRMSLEEETACRQDFDKFFKPMKITKEIEDMRQNIKRLTNAGSYGSTNLGDINPQLAKIYEMKVVNHPARLALERKVTQDVNRGIETFYGMFGTPVTPDSTEKYSKGGAGWKEHVIRCGINNPIQTTASELMMFSIKRAMEVLREAKDTHVCFYKHDEACFYISDEDMANGIKDKLEDITAYTVKGWVPIESEGFEGPKKGVYPSYIL